MIYDATTTNGKKNKVATILLSVDSNKTSLPNPQKKHTHRFASTCAGPFDHVDALLELGRDGDFALIASL